MAAEGRQGPGPPRPPAEAAKLVWFPQTPQLHTASVVLCALPGEGPRLEAGLGGRGDPKAMKDGGGVNTHPVSSTPSGLILRSVSQDSPRPPSLACATFPMLSLGRWGRSSGRPRAPVSSFLLRMRAAGMCRLR